MYNDVSESRCHFVDLRCPCAVQSYLPGAWYNLVSLESSSILAVLHWWKIFPFLNSKSSSCHLVVNLLYYCSHQLDTVTEWMTQINAGYQRSALNCWIAALLYLITLTISAHQLWSNHQNQEQFKVLLCSSLYCSFFLYISMYFIMFKILTLFPFSFL